MHTVGSGRQVMSATAPRRSLPPVQEVAQRHGGGADEQRSAEGDLHVFLLGRPAAEHVQQIGPGKGGWDGAQHHPADQAQVHGALAQVDGGPDRPHQHRGDQVAGDRRRRLHAEQQDQHRRHERAAAGSSQTDQQPDDGAADDDERVYVHGPSRSAGALSARLTARPRTA
jgi:hypothetical protein